MDLAQYFRRQLEYDVWANQEVALSLRKLDEPPAQAVRLLSHIVSAEHVWLSRLQAGAQPFPVWPEFTLAQAEEGVKQLGGLWHTYFAANFPQSFGTFVSYKNTKGESFRSTPEDILTHVFLHSAYHRGQIALVMRQSGYAPAYTDFIHSVRQGWVK